MMIKLRGFAYLALLASLFVLMLVLTAAAETISQQAKRERERQLFFVGEQFRNAIASYYENSPSGSKQFPKNFDVLLKDTRSIKPARHLRQIYSDPITNNAAWGEVRNEFQQIIGVYSLSTERVLITNIDSNIIMVDEGQGILIYSALKFIYNPAQDNKQSEKDS
ncbi:MAG: type II secretion system protein [Methylophagaceae bacterium]